MFFLHAAGLKETTEQLVKKKLEGKDTLTPWEDFLQKKREKKKQKSERKQVTESLYTHFVYYLVFLFSDYVSVFVSLAPPPTSSAAL